MHYGRNGNGMVFALSVLFVIDCLQCRVGANARNGCQPKGTPEIGRTAFRHFVARAAKFSGLLHGRVYAGKSCKFIRGFKPRNIANLGKERSGERCAHSHDCVEFAIKGSELFGNKFLQLGNLLVCDFQPQLLLRPGQGDPRQFALQGVLSAE